MNATIVIHTLYTTEVLVVKALLTDSLGFESHQCKTSVCKMITCTAHVHKHDHIPKSLL